LFLRITPTKTMPVQVLPDTEIWAPFTYEFDLTGFTATEAEFRVGAFAGGTGWIDELQIFTEQ